MTAPLSCDFCVQPMMEDGGVVFQVEPFDHLVDTDTPFSYGSKWPACTECASLVRGRRWRELADRVIPLQVQRDPRITEVEHIVRQELLVLWFKFDQAATGNELDVGE